MAQAQSARYSPIITLVQGNVQNASGLAVPNGSMTLQLNVDATVVAAPYGFVSGAIEINFQFDENGDLVQPAQIYSNAELQPQNEIGLGTYYLVTFYDANGGRINASPMWWQFTQAANSTVDISEVTPFATVGGNVIFYPTSFSVNPPTPTTLGGVFSNSGAAHQWIRAINTNGSVSLSQPAFSDISGTLAADQLPSPLTFGATTFSGLITAQAGIELGVIGSTAGLITLDGATSGQATITAPAVAGTPANPILFSNGINIPSTSVFSINTDTGISRASAGVLDVGNGAQGDASGTVNAARYNVAGSQIAAANLSNGTTGTGAVALAGSPTFTGTVGAAAITATGIIKAAIINAGPQDTVQTASGSTDALTFPGSVFITTAGVDGTTLATPTATTDDGKKITVFDASGHAHTITTASNKIVPSHSVITFGGTVGSWVELESYQGLWYPKASSGVTIS